MVAATRNVLALAALAGPLLAQEPPPDVPPGPRAETPQAPPPSHASLDLFAGSGISFGNARDWNGLRINLRDHDAGTIRGIDLTLWLPHEDAAERIEGLAVGLVPRADELSGLSLGLFATTADARMAGLHVGGLAAVGDGDLDGVGLGGLATVLDGDLHGLALGGLAVVADGDLTGIGLGGLATVTEGRIRGLGLGGLAVVADGALEGVSLGGLATVADGDLIGLHVSGLATVADGGSTGISAAGLASVADGDVTGVHFAGLVVAAGAVEDLGDLDPTGWPHAPSRRATGLMLAGYRVQAHTVEGIAVAGLVHRAHDLHGVGLAAYNAISGAQRGVTVGLFNHAEELHGIQLGLLNHVPSNPPLLRWLPLFNAPF